MKNLFHEILVYDRIHDYCIAHGEYRELEELIATDSSSSYGYAWYVIGGRFKLGEEIIASNNDINRSYRDFLETL